MQGTPLPRWAYVLARIGSAYVIMLAMTVVVLGLAAAVWGLDFRAASLPGLALTLPRACRRECHPRFGITCSIPMAAPGPVVVNLLGLVRSDVHLHSLVLGRLAALHAQDDRGHLPDQGAGVEPAVRVRPALPWWRFSSAET